MQLEWIISEEDRAHITDFMENQNQNPFVQHRQERNLAAEKPPITRDAFWSCMASIRPTSIQRSGPGSAVAEFIRTDPFPLAYETLLGQQDLELSIAGAIQGAGIRHSNRIARDLAANFRRLEAGEWDEALQQCNQLTVPVSRDVERDVANYIAGYQGFGPKQSRNLLQALGLTRFEIPLDSRITDWLNEFGFPLRLSAKALADRHYHEFVLDGIQLLCEECDISPCLLDAAVFAHNDGDAWNHENIVY